MQIALKQLEPSPRPVRMSWSEKAMDELIQSIKEQGVIVPIKVRPLGNPADPDVHKWEIIYGHRRVEASRRAGLRCIEVIIEELDDTTALIQALVENVQREGLSNYNEGLVYKRLQDECELTQKEIAISVGKGQPWVSACILLTTDPTVEYRLNDTPGAARKAQIVRSALGEDLEARRAALDKVAREGLTEAQTRDVAVALKRTQDPEVRERILTTPAVDASIVAGAVKRMAAAERDAEKSRWNYLDESPCAKNFIRQITVNKHHWKRAWQDIERGALGIEHMPYVEERLRKYAAFITELADNLKKRREEAIGGS